MAFGSSSARWRAAGVVLLFLGVTVALATTMAGADLIDEAVEGRTIDLVDRNLSIHHSLNPETRDREYYVTHGLPVLYRLSGTLAVAGVILLLASARFKRVFQAYWDEPARAEDLALFRITIFGAMAWWWWNNPLSLYAALPPALISPPPGLSWAAPVLSLPAWSVAVLSWSFFVASLLAVVGYRTRWSASIATVLAIYVLGVPQFFGKIDHYHHFVWFGALLAASPSGDAWSVDAYRRKTIEPIAGGSSRTYGRPLRAAILLIGTMYLFAGVWKFVIGGVEWGTGETMRTILHAQWMRIDHVPTLRVDELGILTSIGGLGVMLFEVAFITMVVIKRTRLVAAVAGVVFHLSVLFFTGINFWTLLVCYTVFVDTTWLRRSASLAEVPGTAEDVPRRSERTFVFVRNTLVGAALVSGMLLIDSWPVAVYPTFAGVAEPRAWTLTFEAVSPEGKAAEVRPWRSTALRARFGNSRVAGFVSQTVWARETQTRRSKAEALLRVASEDEPVLRHADIIRVYRDLVEVDPARWRDEPIRRELITVWKRSNG